MILRRIFAAVALLCAVTPAYAQKTKAQINTEITTNLPDNTSGQITPSGLRAVNSDIVNSIMPTAPVVSGDLACFSGTTGLLQDCGQSPTTLAFVIGTTVISSGTSNGLLYNNGGLAGNLATVNNGVAVTNGTGVPSISTTLPSALTIPSPTITGAFNATGLVTNADLVNQATTVNGVTCTLGTTCTISASAGSITVGTTTIASGTNTNILYNNAGVLGNYSVTGTGTTAVLAAAPTLTGIPVLGAPTATSIALGGATISTNALAVTGTSLFNSGVTMGAALTYGGVTLSNAVTGTGNMVLGTSPTIATPTISGPTFSGTIVGTYTLGGTPSIAGSAINSGTVSGSFLSNINLAASGNGGVTGTLPVANGGTGSATVPPARVNLNIESATSTGDANYAIQTTDRMVYHTALSAPRTDTLPAANAVNAGQVFVVNDFRGVVTGTNTVTLLRSGADTINGVTSVVAMNAQYGAGIFWSDGVSRWTFFPAATGGGSGTVTSVVVAAGNGTFTSGTCTITVSGTCTVSGSVVEPQGRLTLAANTPVMSATSCSGSPCSNQTTLRYDCYVGGGVPYYDGTNDKVDSISSCEVTDAMVSAASAGQVVASQVYDVWWVHGGANRICLAMSASTGGGGGWASDTGGSNTARGTGYTQIDRVTRPYPTNKNSITNCFNAATNYGPVTANQGTFLGTVYANANGQVSYVPGSAASGGGAGLLGVWNMHQRVLTTTTVTDSASYTYAFTAIRQAHGSAGEQVQFVMGLAEDGINVNSSSELSTIVAVSAFGAQCIGLDTTTTCTSNRSIIYASGGGGAVGDMHPSLGLVPQVGLHILSLNERGDNVNANTFNNQSTAQFSVNTRM